MGTGFRIGAVAGIEVFVDWSLLIIFFLITFGLGAGLFPAWHPTWSAGLAWVTALAAAVLFFCSVFVHELSHALVGRAHGITVRRITLFVFGGMAHMENEPRGWRAEFWMAIVGPLTSLLLGAAFLVLAGVLGGTAQFDVDDPEAAMARLGPLPTLLMWLGPVNIVLGLFNLVPGFPLDGGRVLRAILWGITRDFRKATLWASRGGQAFAWLLIAAGLAMIMGLRVPVFGTGFVGGLWLAFIGWFLNNAALMSYRQVLVREALADVPVARLMRSDVVLVEPDLSLERLMDEHLLGTDQRAFPVMEHHRFLGLACLHDIRQQPRDRWPVTTVRDVMTPADRLTTVTPRQDAAEALDLLSRENVNQLPVLEQQSLVGLLRREDILRWLSVYGDPNLR